MGTKAVGTEAGRRAGPPAVDPVYSILHRQLHLDPCSQVHWPLREFQGSFKNTAGSERLSRPGPLVRLGPPGVAGGTVPALQGCKGSSEARCFLGRGPARGGEGSQALRVGAGPRLPTATGLLVPAPGLWCGARLIPSEGRPSHPQGEWACPRRLLLLDEGSGNTRSGSPSSLGGGS